MKFAITPLTDLISLGGRVTTQLFRASYEIEEFNERDEIVVQVFVEIHKRRSIEETMPEKPYYITKVLKLQNELDGPVVHVDVYDNGECIEDEKRHAVLIKKALEQLHINIMKRA